jgi:hypothetical protein
MTAEDSSFKEFWIAKIEEVERKIKLGIIPMHHKA